MNRIHERSQMIGVYIGCYSVAEIEYMAGTLAVASQRVCNPLTDHFRAFSLLCQTL